MTVTSARILIVEDEPALVRGLTDTFRAQGFEVTACLDGRAGLQAALAAPPHVILLDIMLPGLNGFEVCEAIRDAGLQMPILMLTAKGQEDDVVRGLDAGADDYITKPFRVRELTARVKAFLRRRSRPQTVSRFGDCEVNFDARVVRRADQTASLTAKESKLLQFFIERRGRALSRNVILDAVWGRSVWVTPRSIDRCVTTLRAKIEPDPRSPTCIHTLRDIGYRFDPPETES